MQTSWRQDTDKLTFIACLPPSPTSSSSSFSSSIRAGNEDSNARMVGDINLFLTPSDDNDADYEGSVSSTEATDAILSQNNRGEDVSMTGPEPETKQEVIGEIELMIAQPQHRRQGLGRAALLAFLQYISSHLPQILTEYTSSDFASAAAELKYLRVKIGQENVGSIRLFESVGFKRTSEGPNYFGEVELRMEGIDAGTDFETRIRGVKGWEEVRGVEYSV